MRGDNLNGASPILSTKLRQVQNCFLAYTFPYYITYAPNGWQVLEPMARLEEDLPRPEVRDADIIIVLSHLGVRYDEQIAETYPQVNLCYRESHASPFEEGRLVNETYLAAADRYGYYLWLY